VCLCLLDDSPFDFVACVVVFWVSDVFRGHGELQRCHVNVYIVFEREFVIVVLCFEIISVLSFQCGLQCVLPDVVNVA